ncbi:MAG TPA: AIM24 family protein, partial [Actinomycetes bacterium]|nr:AIM24 family protein [Actinomycetes bacterium]
MIAHKLVSSGQLLVVQLDAGQAVWCQPGRFVWKTPNVTVQARMIGSGGEGGGLLDRALATAISAGRRRLAGDAAALPYFAAGASSGLVAFAGDAGGPI